MIAFQAALHRYGGETFILFVPAPGCAVWRSRANPFALEIPYVELGEEIKGLQARVAFAKQLINVVRIVSFCWRAGS